MRLYSFVLFELGSVQRKGFFWLSEFENFWRKFRLKIQFLDDSDPNRFDIFVHLGLLNRILILMRVVALWDCFRYGSCAKANDFDMYAPNASFEDPLTHAQGYVTNAFIFLLTCSLITLKFAYLSDLGFLRVKQIKSAFYSLAKVLSYQLSFPSLHC